jgi:hypothetical protein
MVFFATCQLLKNTSQQDSMRLNKRYLWLSISLFSLIIPYLIYFLWRVSYFGHLIPNSFYCKSVTEGEIFVVDFYYLIVILPLLAVSMPYLLSRQKDCRHLLLWLPSLLYAIMLFKANPVIVYFLRLFIGPFALFCILPVLGLVYFANELFASKRNVDWAIVLGIVLLTWVCIPGNSSEYLSIKLNDYTERSQIRRDVATLLNNEAKLGDSVYLSDCGIIPFYTRRDLQFIDAQCLNNPELTQSPYKENMPLYANYLMTKVKPDWIIVSYYPEDSHGDYLTDLLYENGFYNQYQLKATLQSGYLDPATNNSKKKVIDFVYQVYKRRE